MLFVLKNSDSYPSDGKAQCPAGKYAVNACLQLGEEEKKRIELRVFRQHEQIVVLLANTYNKANTRSNTYALHPHHEHGYGIQNIKRVIRKYNGTYLVKKEDVYKLMISFPLDVGNVKI